MTAKAAMVDAVNLLPMRARALRLLAVMAFAVFAGCAANPPQHADVGEEAPDAGDAEVLQGAAPDFVDRSLLPKQELTGNLLYEFLIAEIAVQRGNAGDGLAQNERLDAAAGDLNFGKLWHGGPHCPCRPFEIYLN